MLMVSWMVMFINNDDAMGQGWVNKSHSFFKVGLYWTSNQRFNTANKRPWTPDETQGRLHLGFVESATHCGGPCIQGNPQCFIRTAWWRSRKLEFFVHTKIESFISRGIFKNWANNRGPLEMIMMIMMMMMVMMLKPIKTVNLFTGRRERFITMEMLDLESGSMESCLSARMGLKWHSEVNSVKWIDDSAKQMPVKRGQQEDRCRQLHKVGVEERSFSYRRLYFKILNSRSKKF